MLNCIHRVFVHRNLFVVRVFSPAHKPCFLQLNPFSSAATATPKPISKIANQKKSTVYYLINKLGFSPEKAFSASKYLNFESTEKPDSVIAFLENHGFTQEQIGIMVRKFPYLISCDPQKTLLPKIEYFRSSGISETDVTNIFLSAPALFRRSLEKQIMPTFNYIKGLFDSNGTGLGSLKRLPHIFRCDFQSQLLPNVETLREAGVPYSKILILLQYQPRAFMVNTERFRKVVAEVKEMGFNPSEFKFVLAVHALRSMTKSTWDKKLGVYKKWGWSKDDTISAFLKQPYCMVKSANHIVRVMDLLVNKMGFHSSVVSKRPYVLSYSFQKRLKPRSSVYMILWEMGLIKKGDSLPSFNRTERDFLKNVVHRFEEEAPGLLKLYQEELAISKTHHKPLITN